VPEKRHSVVLLAMLCLLALPSAGRAEPTSVRTSIVCDSSQSLTATVPVLGRSRVVTVSLTGTWLANDGATYWIRQIGACVWWTGFSGTPDTPTMGRSFANVYLGTATVVKSSVRIKGEWADVPRGATSGSGPLSLLARPDTLGRFNVLVRTSGGSTASSWKRTA